MHPFINTVLVCLHSFMELKKGKVRKSQAHSPTTSPTSILHSGGVRIFFPLQKHSFRTHRTLNSWYTVPSSMYSAYIIVRVWKEEKTRNKTLMATRNTTGFLLPDTCARGFFCTQLRGLGPQPPGEGSKHRVR